MPGPSPPSELMPLSHTNHEDFVNDEKYTKKKEKPEAQLQNRNCRRRSIKKNNAYKELFRHDKETTTKLLINDPREFFRSWGYSHKEIDDMAKNFPPLLKSLDVHKHLRPKMKFLVHTLGGGGKNDKETRGRTESVSGVFRGSRTVASVSNLAKAIPPQYFGCRLDKTLGPRHAYLVHKNLPHGRMLLEHRRDGASLFQTFLKFGGKASTPNDFVALCNFWEREKIANATTGTSSTRASRQRRHTVSGLERFEKLFRLGLLSAVRSELDIYDDDGINITSKEMVNLLIQHGANPYEVDTGGASLLHWAAGTGNSGAFRALMKSWSLDMSSRVTVGQILMETKCARDEATPFHWACCGVAPTGFGCGGHVDVSRYILQNVGGAEASRLIHSNTVGGNTPLMWAAWSGSLDIIQLLIAENQRNDNGHNSSTIFEHRNRNGCTVVHWACSGGHLHVCQYFYDESAIPIDLFTKPNKLGHTPLHHAITYGHIDVVKWMISTFYDFSSKDPIVDANSSVVAARRTPKMATSKDDNEVKDWGDKIRSEKELASLYAKWCSNDARRQNVLDILLSSNS